MPPQGLTMPCVAFIRPCGPLWAGLKTALIDQCASGAGFLFAFSGVWGRSDGDRSWVSQQGVSEVSLCVPRFPSNGESTFKAAFTVTRLCGYKQTHLARSLFRGGLRARARPCICHQGSRGTPKVCSCRVIIYLKLKVSLVL